MNIFKLSALIFTIVLGTFALLLYIKPDPVVSVNTNATQEIQVASTAAQTRLFYTPSTLSISPFIHYEIPVIIDTHQNEVNQVQVEIAYDPGIIEVTAIKPGDFFSTPDVILQEINQNTGSIHYALRLPGNGVMSGTGALAVLTLRSNPVSSASGKTTLHFRQRSAVMGPTQDQSLLQSTEDLVITVGSKPAVMELTR